MARSRVVVAMSGGVDSSLAAALLVEQGHDVVGIALQLWDYSNREPDDFGSCCSPDDLQDARRVAWELGIPFYVSNAEALFRREVVDRFTADYLQGLTPNPCVRCNDRVKFERLLTLAQGLGAQYLATGHYSRIELNPASGRYHMYKGADALKDQSYFLFTLRQDQLARILFPLGKMTKEQVREEANKRGLPTASKHESMEICFVGNTRYADFLQKEVKTEQLPRPGKIVDEQGRVLGHHRGVHHYTIGQRKGLGVVGPTPYYVVGIRGDEVVVGPDQSLWKYGLVARDMSWVTGEAPAPGVQFTARVRHHGREVPASVVGVDGDLTFLELGEPQRAISPGQAVVLYRDDELLGGGWIQGPWEDRLPPGEVGVGVTL